MKVHLKLYSIIQDEAAKNITVSLSRGATVSDLMQQQSISADDVCVLVVNKQDATFDTILNDNDSITMIPPIAGG